ncbi:hypothetical protein ACFPES_01675 [Paenibacillus sp. GCM10023248]|uniref:hypothetical protein n=1 Tax=unclassified Paenibacillus TaxID=185978 RepID=UPI0023790E9A|nr:hypothetical protein [Paenibacillus sp. MAHUQ-63]MDD9265732.1 hypothetical protein [Paenibacillus sp. MAHUQ-63]
MIEYADFWRILKNTMAIGVYTLVFAFPISIVLALMMNELRNQLEESMSAYRHILIHERGNPENNYTAWLNASLACVYAAQGAREGLVALIEAPGGFVTVSLNGQSQAEHTGRCVQFMCGDGQSSTYVWLQSDAAYPYAGCRLDRHLLLTADWMLDWFEVVQAEGSVESLTDWWLHPVVPPLSGRLQEVGAAGGVSRPPIAVPFGESTLDLPVTGSFAPEAGQAVPIEYRLPGGSTVWHTAWVMPGQELLAVQTPGLSTDPSVRLTGLLHRVRG